MYSVKKACSIWYNSTIKKGLHMNIGNIIKWSWYLGTDWEQTEFQGLVVDTIIAKTDYEKVRVLVVLTNDGDVLDVRDDAPGLELVA